MLNLAHVVTSSKDAAFKTVAIIAAMLMVFGVFEPVVSYGASTNTTFVINQTITDEISFTTPYGTTTTMTGSIAGLTGGSATGSVVVVVRTNSFNGYNMDIAFSGTPAMRGITTSNTGIRNHATGTEPSFLFLSSSSAQFAYSVTASNTADVDQSFLNNGVSCNAVAGSSTFGRCWAGPSTTNFRIVNRGTSAGTGATTTITFSLVVPSNPSPVVEADTYQATATLTATNQ